WETHYGEVARNMVEFDNYIDTFWGSPWDPNGVKREREGFYSKPPLTMWLMSGGMNLLGHNEWGVRLFFPLIMILALMAVYLAVSRFYSRRTGVIAAALLATSPFISMMSRQAVTDGPMVAIMTIGMMALGFGLFGVEDEDEAASPWLYWSVLGLLVLVMGWQLYAMLPMDRSPDVIRPYPGDRGPLMAVQWYIRELFTVGKGKGWFIALTLAPIAGYAAWRVSRERRRRLMYVYLFYIACGLTVPAKGWLGWAPMGGAIFGYLVVTGEWRILTWVQVPVGFLIVFVTGHPWIIAMLGGHHPDWFKRFWIHDHVNRLFSGVHSTDDGGFEYFVQWVGYGLFPWIGLLPAGFARVLGGLRARAEGYTPQQRFEILVFIWGLFSFFLFSKSSTKFHHYILPAIPPLGIVAALYLGDLLDGKAKAPAVLMSAAAAIVVWIGLDVVRQPAAYGQGSQNWVNLFTYKYDRQWPQMVGEDALSKLEGEALENALTNNQWLLDLAQPVMWITLFGVVAFVLMAVFRDWKRSYGASVLGIGGVWMSVFALHTYLPKVADHWSQAQMWDAYYQQCTPFQGSEEDWQRHLLATAMRVPVKAEYPRVRCQEPIVAYRMNWRGETFYSGNTVLPAIETKHLKPFIDGWGEDNPFFLFTERSRVKGELEPHLPEGLKGRYEVVFGKNRKFVLLRVDKKLPPDGAEPAADKVF
ncbi:MAG: glycosyltransferase family 39 protein, partial [Myxococcales bacterium]|nr:glycosyltransferase family 39 protein [Myxococcales bacterium]